MEGIEAVSAVMVSSTISVRFVYSGSFFAIDVSLSVDDGGESASLESSYDVDTDVAVSEESIAGADQPGIENTR